MQKMNADQFRDWKDNSEFFFNHLKELVGNEPERMAEIGRQLADGATEDIPKLHKYATILGAKATILQEIIDIEHHDIFKEQGGEDE